MSTNQFSTESNYLRVIRGLHRLHSLSSAGDDQGPEAGAIRDDMDHPWNCLSDTEKRRLEGLSEDLYSLHDPAEPVQDPTPESQRGLAEVLESRKTGEFEEALTKLRRWKHHVIPSMASYLRSSIWREAGDPATATLFYEHSRLSNPENGNDESLCLSALEKNRIPPTR